MKVRFGIIADLHAEHIPDGASRFRRFLGVCLEKNVDFCVQLGDFCPPGDKNAGQKRKIMSLLREISLPFYHVLGNHDTDENTKSDVLSYMGETSPYTSFDVGGVHFIILDACYYREGERYFSYDKGNYKSVKNAEISVIPPVELNWLKNDLAKTKLPSVIFSHQSLIESRTGIRNADELRRVIESAPSRVLLCICGHEHVDRLEHKNGIAYYCLNSASYYWAGSKYIHTTYGDKTEAVYPNMRKVFPYREPLFAVIDINDSEISISGTASHIVGTLPSELDFHKDGLADEITASIIDRKWKII